MRRKCSVTFKILTIIAASFAVLQSAKADVATFADEAVPRLSQYLKVDTVNPPGNEYRGVAYLSQLLDDAGITYTTAESAEGRGNLWATLEGSADKDGNKKPALILLHHIDVVPANLKFWTVDPLSGDIADGYVYGRGAIDTKGLGIAQLQAFLALAESGLQLNRDIIFMATADGGAGGFFGAGWLVENRPEIFSGVGYVLNEGGSGRRYGEYIAVMVEVTQKVPLWLRLTALGKPGHGSAPQMQTSVTRLIRGLKRVSETEFPVNVIAPVAQMFEGLAPYQSGANRSAFANLVKAVENPDYLLGLKLNNPAGHALLRNTCSITTLEGSSKINVVPAQAHAELDCRLLPDQDPEAFLVDLNNIINDKQISIERIMGFTPAISRTDTPLYKAIAKVSEQAFSAPVIPTVAGGFTDSHFFRDLGVTSYGYSPFVFAPGEFSGVHGNDERLGIENLKQGVHTLYQLLVEFAVQQ